jgi:AcrR family transcriptional regulator
MYAVNPQTSQRKVAPMAIPTVSTARPRSRLSRERVLRAAIVHADAGGLEALTMRRLAEELGVAPMALYRHVANRDDLIDGMVDIVFSEIDVPSADGDWKAAMRRRAISVRDALARHRWAIGLMESRASPGPANLRHHDAVIGSLRAGGFDMAMVAHVYSLLDSYIYGFALTKMNLPFQSGDNVAEIAQTMLEPFPIDEYPNLVAFITEVAMKPGYDYGDEFESGLDAILDGSKWRGGPPEAPGPLGR